MSRNTYTPPTPCPECGYVLLRATGEGEKVPHPGAISICAECYALLMFDADLSLRRWTEEERAEIMANAEMCAKLAYYIAGLEIINRRRKARQN